jgi:nitrile hydratase
MVSVDRVADVASITTKQELKNDDELLQPLDRSITEYAYWEQQIDAVLELLSKKDIMNDHMLRKGIESIDKEVYNKLSYYERWAISIAKRCLESGVLTQEDLNKKYGPPLNSTDEQLFQVGDKVRVHHENYATRWIKPHLRTPGYLYGKTGTIERYCGSYPNPEYFAYDNTDSTTHQQPLYRVRFNQKSIWDQYEGGADDSIDVEIYQHWLMPASTQEGEDHHEHDVGHQHKDHHHHHHHYDDHDHGHIHEARAIVEQTAINREGTPLPAQHLAESLVSALLDKNIINSEELRKQIETNQMTGVEQRGANIVVEAWLNPEFKERLLENGTKTIAEFLKLDDMETDMVVLENTDKIHNLVVCTLCSCYPRQLLGVPPGWYKSRSYRVRAPRNPRSVLEEFGTVLPNDMKIQVHDSTADLRYLVIPRRPANTQHWSREQLLPIVTRDSMIGVCDITV